MGSYLFVCFQAEILYRTIEKISNLITSNLVFIMIIFVWLIMRMLIIGFVRSIMRIIFIFTLIFQILVSMMIPLILITINIVLLALFFLLVDNSPNWSMSGSLAPYYHYHYHYHFIFPEITPCFWSTII